MSSARTGRRRSSSTRLALKQVLGALERLEADRARRSAECRSAARHQGRARARRAGGETKPKRQARAEAMLANLGEALDGMVRARAEEGRRLQAVVLDQLAAIERSGGRDRAFAGALARSDPAAAEGAGGAPAGDGSRRSMKVASTRKRRLLATRADAEEELKRLDRAHCRRARTARSRASRPAGASISWRRSSIARPTRCAPKSNDADTTRAGLELKAVIDQMREQVQNIE